MNNPLNDAELAEVKAAMGRGMTPTWEEVDRLLDLVEYLESEVKDADLNTEQAISLSNQRKQEGNRYREALESIIAHQNSVAGPGMTAHSTVCTIARNALKG